MKEHFYTSFTIALSLIGLVIENPFENRRDAEETSAQKQKAKIPERGVAVLQPTEGRKVSGVIMLTQTEKGVRVRGRVSGLKPGKHGFHIHEYGDLRAPDGTSAGGHFAPKGHKHGGPDAAEHHAGDLGNIIADSRGRAEVDLLAEGLKLHFVIGRSIVVHAGADDLKSQPSGDAGPRAALGVIGFANSSRRDVSSK